MEHLVRSDPYFQILKRSNKKQRRQLMKQFPAYVSHDVAEIVFNLLRGVVPITPRKKSQLNGVKCQLFDLVNTKDKKKRQKMLYNQSGTGVFSILLPILVSVIGGLVSA